MAARRLILVMLVLLVVSSIAAALVPVERNRLRNDSTSSTSTTTAAEPAIPEGELLHRTISAGDPTPERLRLQIGDQLELTVTSPRLADQVEIAEFGALDDVDPDFAAHFDLLLLSEGSFPVRLVEANRVIAQIEVAGEKRPRRK